MLPAIDMGVTDYPTTTVYTLSGTRNPQLVRYVGVTNQSLSKRLAIHRSTRRGSAKQNYRVAWIRKVFRTGEDLIITPIAVVPREFWERAERFAITEFRRQPLGRQLTNAADGGVGAPGCVVPQHVRDRLRDRMKGRVFTSEHRLRISLAKTGQTHSEATRAILSLKGKARRHSVETRQRISKSGRGKKRSAEICAAISARQKGRTNTPESIQKRKDTLNALPESVRLERSQRFLEAQRNRRKRERLHKEQR